MLSVVLLPLTAGCTSTAAFVSFFVVAQKFLSILFLGERRGKQRKRLDFIILSCSQFATKIGSSHVSTTTTSVTPRVLFILTVHVTLSF